VPAINRVEFYPTFRCNDCCGHCITNSGPNRTETLKPDDAATISPLDSQRPHAYPPQPLAHHRAVHAEPWSDRAKRYLSMVCRPFGNPARPRAPICI